MFLSLHIVGLSSLLGSINSIVTLLKSSNLSIINPLVTPNNILPEWYYLLFHSCPRSFPNKTIGVILVLNLLIMIIEYEF